MGGRGGAPRPVGGFRGRRRCGRSAGAARWGTLRGSVSGSGCPAAVAVGVPVNLCAGEEVLLTAPLAGMGFTMGHAIAFALAGTGICVSSLPLLRAILGKRAMLAMVALYLVVPFALGVALTALPFTPRLEPRTPPGSSPSIEVGAPTPPQSIIDKSR